VTRAVDIDLLFGERYDAMVRLAFLLTGNRAVAEDVVQDAFARVQQRWERVAYPSAYLRTAVVNGCRGYHRRERRARAHLADLLPATPSAETPVIWDALRRLPYRQRAALVLRFYEDRPEREIADALGCRPATVRSLIHRGLAKLREEFER
jgi:RNA polymerase sigma-70 factor (sigma-E family)